MFFLVNYMCIGKLCTILLQPCARGPTVAHSKTCCSLLFIASLNFARDPQSLSNSTFSTHAGAKRHDVELVHAGKPDEASTPESNKQIQINSSASNPGSAHATYSEAVSHDVRAWANNDKFDVSICAHMPAKQLLLG